MGPLLPEQRALALYSRRSAVIELKRHIKLEATGHAGAVRFLSGLQVQLDEGKTSSVVTVTRTGKFRDPRYGDFEISREMLLAMVANFDKRVYGQDIFVDVAHNPDTGAAAKIQKLMLEGDRLRAQVEWTPYGVDAVRSRGYAYLSAEYHENWQDNETSAKHGPVLLGAALTVRPVIKRLDPIQLSESAGDMPTLLHPELQTKLLTEIRAMWKELIEKLRKQLAELQLAEPVIKALAEACEKALANVADKTAAEALVASFEASGKQLAEQIGDKVIKLDIAVPEIKTGLSADDVKKLISSESERAAGEAKKLIESRAAKIKLLGDTIAAAPGLDDPLKKDLTDSVADLVTHDLTDEQIKKLAATQIAMGNRLAASSQLAAIGFQWPQGKVHLSVDSGSQIKSLQETFDRRAGIFDAPLSSRFEKTGGQLPEINKKFAEKVLALYDAQHGARLYAEHKLLAGGDGVVSDVAIPAIFERTVIREALYQLVGLQFVDVGTVPFSATALVPYSFRDTSAAGRGNTRKYEGQSIARAGVKQLSDTVYPIPQKLAFEVSDELRLLTSNGQLDWEIVSENQKNAQRIIGEDLEKLIFDEVLNASDEYAVTSVVAEAVAGVNGTNKIFVLANFPVLRPRKIFDIQGNQVGSTVNPITVTYNSIARQEYDGSNTQVAGLYYMLDYNLGEIRIVNELGVLQTPANATPFTVTYGYSTNVYAFDTDLGTDKTDEHWDKFLYRYGLRKTVIEDDRYYMANFGLMRGAVHSMIEQARQFGANSVRPGTDLTANGNLGRIKDVANYKAYAPGLAIGDQRVVIGQRGATRLRVMKPWSMEQLENQKDVNGRFTGKKEAYGTQWLVLHTPTLWKAAYTSIALYSTTARVARVS